ncbi:Type II/III secretion system protein [Candidatus Sulfotelmatobacter kueseliae]|uniref:Type II/III secretion system protein n=1 Tax=Candidatus Sulfotelmatobacter kueseliae TaxID=2042962 RepID=A0A2U3K240_9BACT|nr:Type II/III secretion system protein [Candidatus Sulfotelmatobacter kueseliae]
MKVRTSWLGALLLALILVLTAPAEVLQQADTTGQSQNPTPTATQTATLPPQSESSLGSAPLRVMVGKSLLINTTERLRRISVTDPAIASALPVTPTQIMVHGKAPGEVSLLIWDELERSRSFDLRVDVDISACAEEEHRVFPDEQIVVTPSRAAIVLSGHVSTEDVAKRAGELATAYSPKVVNVLTFGPVGSQEVLLQVKFAEVDRSALTQMGVNFVSNGATNTIGTLTTGQFGGFGPVNVQTSQTTSPLGGTATTNSGTQTINNVLNLFLFRPDINFGAVIEALQTKNLLQILAEPNLIAVNGKEASFLAGGQFPFPIVQPGAGFTAVTISFKDFGVNLKFTPVIMPNGNIHLKVAPEVSTLDYANALTISGFTVPALSTRKAETEFELQDGQSFVIAGLIDNRVTDIYNKIPGLGDIPILGAFFRSKSLQKSNSELMVLCTVRRVSPSAETPTLPKNPKPFIDNGKFDKPQK